MITGAPVNVLDYGADPTGVANSTAAFQAASAVIQTNDGGKLVIPAGTYTVGSQTFAGAFGQGYSYRGARIINIRNCTNPVVIEFQGAKLKLANGLKFGSFNPVTGAVYNPASMPFTNADYAADVGVFIDIEDNQNVTITGSCELDGNIQNIALGGTWGDTGYQCISYGILAYGNLILSIENVYTHHHALDGIVLGWIGQTATDPARPTTLTNIVSEYNARQGISIVGGTGITVNDSKFNFTGRSTFNSGPSAGIDIEAESGVVRRLVFNNCEAIANVGVGFLADSGDSADITCNDCKFVGTTNYSIWPKKPQMVFNSCLIVGSMVNTFGSATDSNLANKFVDCRITDFVAYGFGGLTYNGSGLLVDSGGGGNVQFDNCIFEAGRQKLGSFILVNFRNCTMIQSAGTDVGIANRDWVALLNGSIFNNLRIIDLISSVPVDGYFISMDGTEIYYNNNYLTSLGPIRWFTWSAAAGGSTGALGQNNGNLAPNTYLALGKSTGNRLIGFYGQLKIVAGPAVPTVDTWAVGDRCINSNPIVGQPKGWACTVAGTGAAATWVSEGNL
jgi:hypothetical protein